MLDTLLLSWQAALQLGLWACLTSFVAGVIGFAGGMMLLTIMPFYLPAAVIIPLHGISQLASNTSRAAFSYKALQWQLLPKFMLGSVLGVVLASLLYELISLQWATLFIGCYILFNLWWKNFKGLFSGFESYFSLGFLQSGLALIVGAPGPISMSLLMRHFAQQEVVIATMALFMVISHSLKIIAFGFLGVDYSGYWLLIIFLIFGAVSGSFLAKRVRSRIDNATAIRWIKLLLTLLAVHMIVKTALRFWE